MPESRSLLASVLKDEPQQPMGLFDDIRQYTGAPQRAIGGLLDSLWSGPSIVDQMRRHQDNITAVRDLAQYAGYTNPVDLMRQR